MRGQKAREGYRPKRANDAVFHSSDIRAGATRACIHSGEAMTRAVPLDGIKISRRDALELVRRMNENWPGKYRLDWRNERNPLFRPEYYQQANAN